MAVLGDTSEPTSTAEAHADAITMFAHVLTMPTGGPWTITHVAVWAAGYGGNATARNILWDGSSGAINGQSADYTLIQRTFTPSGSDLYNKALTTPKVIGGGGTIIVGFQTMDGHGSFFGRRATGSHREKDAASYPDDMASNTTHSVGAMGAYITYEAANTAPNAPTLNDPTAGEVVQSQTPTLNFTPSDPDGDTHTGYTYQVDNNSDFSSPLESTEVNGSFANEVAINRVVTSTLTRGTTYYWRVKTKDSANGYGAYSAGASFVVNQLPTAPTLTSPADSATITDTTPTLIFTHNDPESDACASYDIEVDTTTGSGVVPDWASLKWSVTNGTSGISGTTITRDVSTVLSPNQWYAWRARTADASGDGAWSTPRYFIINNLPTAPTLTSPGSGLTVLDTTPTLVFTHNDPDSNPCASYDIQVDSTTGVGVVPDWATLAWEVIDGTTGINATTVTRDVGSALTLEQWYAWRARTADAQGDGPWSSPFYFFVSSSINQIPNAPTLTSPSSNATLPDTTPTLVLTHNDQNGDACASYDIQVDATTGHGVEPDWAGLAWEVINGTTGISGTTITVDVGSALSLDTWYAWRARTSDAVGDGPWSSTRYFRISQTASSDTYSTATPRPKYTILIREFANLTDFRPGAVVAAIDKFHHLAYAEYVNEVGEAFFSIAQGDPKAALLRSIVEEGAIMQILRDGFLVWAGWLSEVDEGPTDAIFYAYSYFSGLFKLHTDWAAEWTNAQLDTIVSETWARAQSLPQSRMAWMTTGSIEAPVTTSGGGVAYVQGLYKTYHKRILFVMKELAAAGMSDTTNRVVVEITPSGEFNFWKNRGELLTNEKWLWTDPRILSYRRFRRPIDHANTLIGVGDTPRSVIARYTAEDTADRAAVGRAEETVYFPWVRDEKELSRVTNLRLARALRIDADLGLTFAPRALTPFRASGQSYKLTDTVPVTIQNGVTDIAAEEKMILGQQVLVQNGEEFVRPLLGDRL